VSVLEELIKAVDYKNAIDSITGCIRNYVRKAGASGIVLGLSGGVDSSVVAALAREAIGEKSVTALIMPEKEVSREAIEDAISVAEMLGIKYYVLDITGLVEETLKLFGSSYTTADKKAKGNVKVRQRMVLLYYYANTRNMLVAATSNRSEFLLGYFTKWGDASGDIYPILSLYKTQVQELGRLLGLPERILRKPSSPQLWPGQTAEAELGLPYSILDQILYLLIDKQEPIGAVCEELKLPKELVESVWNRVLENEHKRNPLKRCVIGTFPSELEGVATLE